MLQLFVLPERVAVTATLPEGVPPPDPLGETDTLTVTCWLRTDGEGEMVTAVTVSELSTLWVPDPDVLPA